MRTKWSDLKNETMSPVTQRKARELAERDLAEIEMRKLRETLKVTQEELANRLKVTQVAVSRQERHPLAGPAPCRHMRPELGDGADGGEAGHGGDFPGWAGAYRRAGSTGPYRRVARWPL